MDVQKRTILAEQLLQIIFSLREDDSPVSQAWVLSIANTAMTRAILASVGPTGDASDLVALSCRQLVKSVADVQSKFIRSKLTLTGRD